MRKNNIKDIMEKDGKFYIFYKNTDFFEEIIFENFNLAESIAIQEFIYDKLKIKE